MKMSELLRCYQNALNVRTMADRCQRPPIASVWRAALELGHQPRLHNTKHTSHNKRQSGEHQQAMPVCTVFAQVITD